MKQKEISNFSYGVVAVLGAAGLLFSLMSPNGSASGALVSGLFVVVGAVGIVRNRRRARRQ